jgi:hypothetical protein
MASVSPRHIVALLLILSVAMDAHRAFAQQNETRIALLIGNASYPDAEAPLKDPVNNVRALADELRRSRFEVDVGENTKEAVRAAFDRFYGKIKPGSRRWCFLAAMASSPTGRPMSSPSMRRSGPRPTCGAMVTVSICSWAR